MTLTRFDRRCAAPPAPRVVGSSIAARVRAAALAAGLAPVLVAGLVPALAAGPRGVDRDKPNPAAPPETAQFAFLVGDWDCTTRFVGPDGQARPGRARWIGYFILDGWAIQDDWIGYRPDGSESHGTNVRSFNPRTRKWDNRWLPAGSLQWTYFEAEKVGDTMVMLGRGEDARGAFLDRNTFYDIGENGWKWRKDRSYDDGETWFEGVGHIEARRRRDTGRDDPTPTGSDAARQ